MRYLIFSLILILPGCGSHSPKKVEAAPEPPVSVSVVPAEQVEWPITYEATGTVRAAHSAVVSARIMGYIRELRLNPGDRVTTGQVVAIIDSQELEAAVNQARTAEDAARAGIAEADNGIAAAKAQLGLAQVTFRRMEDLFQKKSISNQEYDEARARLQTAEAAHQMALSRRAQLDARIAQAKQGVATANITRSYAQVIAPISGVVTEKQAEQGQLATPGAPLVTIEQAGAYRLEVPVEESMLAQVKMGQSVTVLLDAVDQTLTGRVAEIVPAIDPASRSFLVKVALPPSPVLRSGLFGRLRMSHGLRQSLVIPAAAVSQRGELQSVFVAESGHAHARMITAGQKQDGKVEVLSGLQPGERIIHPRSPTLRDGSKVEVRQ